MSTFKSKTIKILVVSDLHLEFERTQSPVGPKFTSTLNEIDLVLLAGDTWAGPKTATWICEWAERLNVRVAWVAGNHEFYSHKIEKTIKAFRSTCQKSRRVDYLEKDAVELEVHDRKLRVLGTTLWTDFALYGNPAQAKAAASDMMNDFRKITEDVGGKAGIYTKFRPDHAQKRHFLSRIWLNDELSKPFDGTTIVMTHHSPHPNSVPGRYRSDAVTPAYASDLTEMLTEHEISLWVHGHTHVSFDYEVGGTRVVCNPRGYEGYEPNDHFDPLMLVEV
ncbi:metallophosphoesterase [Magnetovibrio sp. PR-2]|uniref:metallophosphoesterase n=1 Tax=Magnetovibrio sp. PR-2 TaxID=3120356 RepID=UPI002FCE3B1D